MGVVLVVAWTAGQQPTPRVKILWHKLTEMEVVVLGVANDEQEHNGVDDS